MAKVIVHIGLPKTATTTLQIDVFPKVNREMTNYLGVIQPRNHIQNKLYFDFYSAIDTGENIKAVNILLKKELEKGKDILVSEEMIVVGDWKNKLINLKKTLRGLEYLIIVGVRDPAEAMVSYYIELNKIFTKEKLRFLQIAMNNNMMKIYHYRLFFAFINELFAKKNVVVISFEEIINNNFSKLKNIVSFETDFHSKNRNKKRQVGNKILMTENKPLSNLMFSFVPNKVKDNLKSNKRLKLLVKPIYSYFKNIPIKKTYLLEKPSEDEVVKLREYMYLERVFLKDEYQIDYLSKRNK